VATVIPDAGWRVFVCCYRKFICLLAVMLIITSMRSDVLDLLAQVARDLIEDQRLESGLQRIADTALAVLGGDHASVRLCQPDGSLEACARAGLGSEHPPPRFECGQGVLGWVAEHGEVARVSESRCEPRFVDRRRERGFDVGSLLSVPIAGGDATLGVLTVSSAQPSSFGEAEEAIGKLLAAAAAQTVRTAELRELAMTDSQTRAYNRRGLLPRLCEEIERARRHGEPLSVLLIDLDHFKRVNDRHGHAVGDAVLRAFADTVRECVRAADVLFRRGGEEFVLVMPSTDAEQARQVAERLRARLDGGPLRVRDDVLLMQTASIGVATWDGAESAEELEERADLAMYEAKRLGRNRVETAPARPRLPCALTLG
jgi:diguanylate cyclase (GGDEF)-like protein